MEQIKRIKSNVKVTVQTMARVDTTCPGCGVPNAPVMLTTDQVTEWQYGALLQNVAPELSADQREHLISGVCASCYYGTTREHDQERADMIVEQASKVIAQGQRGIITDYEMSDQLILIAIQ